MILILEAKLRFAEARIRQLEVGGGKGEDRNVEDL
jgi:hypothetical protein